MFRTDTRRALGAAACFASIATSALAQGGLTQPKQGQGGSVVKGAAGTGGSLGDKGLEHCDKPMGAMAVLRTQRQALTAAAQDRLSSPVGLIRLMLQQSNCFIVVERGVGMR